MMPPHSCWPADYPCSTPSVAGSRRPPRLPWACSGIRAARRLLDEPDQASRRYREQCQDTPGIGDVVTSAMRGAVAACRGQVKTAARWFRQSLASGADTGMVAFTLLVDLPGVLGMAGDAPAARQALDELDAARHHGFVYLEPELLLTRAWVAAAEGSVSEATTLARHAAELAASHPQPAVEVLALPTAVCFGDCTVADRLAVLATKVDGPRAPAAAAHAAALAAAGLSNRQIADRLVVSVRTVEGHLYRACTKLGAGDRTGLAALIRPSVESE